MFLWCLGVQGSPQLNYFILYLIQNATFRKSVFYTIAYCIAYFLREFVLNSRHSGPWREKWGWERRLLRHFGRIRGLPWGRADEFREAISYAQPHANGHICPELGIQFSTNLRKSACSPQGVPRDPKGTPEGPPRSPKGAPREPEGVPRDPMGSPGTPKGSPRDPHGSPRNPQGTPWGPQGAQGQPKGSQVCAQVKPRDPKASPSATQTSQEDKLYIKKLPIDRLRGKLVIVR